MKYLSKIDKQLLKWAYQKPYKHSFLIKALIFIGDGPFWMLVVLVVALIGQFLRIESFVQLSILLIFGLMISNIVFGLCKTKVKRKRPYADIELKHELQIEIQNRDPGHGSKEFESFPSGHVLWTTLCVCLLCIQFGFISVILFWWMIPTMMYLRLHLGVHFPSDVLAGLILGLNTASITFFIAPGLLEVIEILKVHTLYVYGYWAFMSVFLIVGFKSWLKRV